MLKPVKEIFEYVVNDLGTPPDRIIFFDDQDLNVAAAKQVGLQAFVTRGIVELESELGRLGVL